MKNPLTPPSSLSSLSLSGGGRTSKRQNTDAKKVNYSTMKAPQHSYDVGFDENGNPIPTSAPKPPHPSDSVHKAALQNPSTNKANAHATDSIDLTGSNTSMTDNEVAMERVDSVIDSVPDAYLKQLDSSYACDEASLSHDERLELVYSSWEYSSICLFLDTFRDILSEALEMRPAGSKGTDEEDDDGSMGNIGGSTFSGSSSTNSWLQGRPSSGNSTSTPAFYQGVTAYGNGIRLFNPKTLAEALANCESLVNRKDDKKTSTIVLLSPMSSSPSPTSSDLSVISSNVDDYGRSSGSVGFKRLLTDDIRSPLGRLIADLLGLVLGKKLTVQTKEWLNEWANLLKERRDEINYGIDWQHMIPASLVKATRLSATAAGPNTDEYLLLQPPLPSRPDVNPLRVTREHRVPISQPKHNQLLSEKIKERLKALEETNPPGTPLPSRSDLAHTLAPTIPTTQLKPIDIDVDYFSHSIPVKLRLLRLLCDWALDSVVQIEVSPDEPPETIRSRPLGCDDEGTSYYAFWLKGKRLNPTVHVYAERAGDEVSDLGVKEGCTEPKASGKKASRGKPSSSMSKSNNKVEMGKEKGKSEQLSDQVTVGDAFATDKGSMKQLTLSNFKIKRDTDTSMSQQQQPQQKAPGSETGKGGKGQSHSKPSTTANHEGKHGKGILSFVVSKPDSSSLEPIDLLAAPVANKLAGEALIGDELGVDKDDKSEAKGGGGRDRLFGDEVKETIKSETQGTKRKADQIEKGTSTTTSVKDEKDTNETCIAAFDHDDDDDNDVDNKKGVKRVKQDIQEHETTDTNHDNFNPMVMVRGQPMHVSYGMRWSLDKPITMPSGPVSNKAKLQNSCMTSPLVRKYSFRPVATSIEELRELIAMLKIKLRYVEELDQDDSEEKGKSTSEKTQDDSDDDKPITILKVKMKAESAAPKSYDYEGEGRPLIDKLNELLNEWEVVQKQEGRRARRQINELRNLGFTERDLLRMNGYDDLDSESSDDDQQTGRRKAQVYSQSGRYVGGRRMRDRRPVSYKAIDSPEDESDGGENEGNTRTGGGRRGSRSSSRLRRSYRRDGSGSDSDIISGSERSSSSNSSDSEHISLSSDESESESESGSGSDSLVASESDRGSDIRSTRMIKRGQNRNKSRKNTHQQKRSSNRLRHSKRRGVLSDDDDDEEEGEEEDDNDDDDDDGDDDVEEEEEGEDLGRHQKSRRRDGDDDGDMSDGAKEALRIVMEAERSERKGGHGRSTTGMMTDTSRGRGRPRKMKTVVMLDDDSLEDDHINSDADRSREQDRDIAKEESHGEGNERGHTLKQSTADRAKTCDLTMESDNVDSETSGNQDDHISLS